MLSTQPIPLGVTQIEPNRFRFAVYSDTSSPMTVSTYHPENKLLTTESLLNQIENIWHIELELTPPFLYSFSTEIPHILDPYAKHMVTKPYPLSAVNKETPFNWEKVKSPNYQMKELIIYELHIKGFAKTYLGLIEKIPYLKSLGINAIELMPLFAFDNKENYWGYAPLSFFAPMDQYSTSNEIGAPKHEFQQMVKALHQNGIEVILDVVYNHTGNTHSLGALAKDAYYLHNDYSGCGNTLNANHPITTQLILDSLHYWVQEMHVDGFRFDLASTLTRGEKGEELSSPPILKAILDDPSLKNTKLIAEPWDAAGGYHVGKFPLHGNKWAEWNDQYRNDVREFLRGNRSNFIKRISGSGDLYGKDRTPAHSINFITCHDGFTLKDLVSYNKKYNHPNGEKNQDGSNHNLSWNCGTEGETNDPKVNQLRLKQQKNFILALMLSQGVPLIRMGDEYGHTCHGNNNPWNQDSPLNWFDWKKVKKETALSRFFRLAIGLRKRFPFLSAATFLDQNDLKLLTENEPLTAFILHKSLLIAFNPKNKAHTIELPTDGWRWVANTENESPNDLYEKGKESPCTKQEITIQPFSTLIVTRNT